MPKQTYSIEIERPLEEVFAYAADFTNRTEWLSNMEETRWTSEGPVQVGSTWRETVRMLGRRMYLDYVVTAYEPNKKVAGKTTSGPVSMEFSITVESTGSGTRMDMAGQWTAKGFLKLATPLLRLMTRRQFVAAIGRLKNLLEAHAELR